GAGMSGDSSPTPSTPDILATLGPDASDDQIRAACEWIARLGDELARERYIDELAKRTKRGKRVLRAVIRDCAAALQAKADEILQGADPREIKTILPDAPVPDGTRLPAKYDIDRRSGEIMFFG